MSDVIYPGLKKYTAYDCQGISCLSELIYITFAAVALYSAIAIPNQKLLTLTHDYVGGTSSV